MKIYKFIVTLFIGLLLFSSCDSWLNQKDLSGLSQDEAYSSDAGISSVIANLYSRMRYEQDFQTDADSYDLTSWDEAINNSAYWAFANNKNANYRVYYDYGLIRDINSHLESLDKYSEKINANSLAYYKAEARFLRAMVYFTMVTRLGGVPIVTNTMQYTSEPSSLALPRNKESEVYDFIADEVDAIVDDLNVQASVITQTRASKGSALALKCRAMLYAGTLAYNYDVSTSKGVNLPSGAVGIPKSMANIYLKKSLDAFTELENMNYYSLYSSNPDLSTNYANLFINRENNKEIIFCKAYDGVTMLNYFTQRAIPRSQTGIARSGAQINPTLNLVNSYEILSTKEIREVDAYVGDELVEPLNMLSSTSNYNIFDKPEDIFAGRDPRLAGTILYPGTSFRSKPVDLQAGLAVLEANGSYTFKTSSSITTISDNNINSYNGEKITGLDGPYTSGDGNWYISQSGFLLRKFVDVASGSELQGNSKVPYIIFRYGEALLNAAEAAFLLSQLGDTYNGNDPKALSLTYINKVRERAGGSGFQLTLDKLDFHRIVNERRVELAFEDHRYNDLKRWRIADEVWVFDRNNMTSIMYGLWPYKIYAPGNIINGKWIFRKVKLEHRGSASDLGMPLNFDRTMYYSVYPMNDGNPLIEKNPNH